MQKRWIADFATRGAETTVALRLRRSRDLLGLQRLAPQQEAARTVGQGAAKPEASTPTQQVACTIHAAPDDYSQGVRPWK